MRLLVHLRNHVHVATNFPDHGVDVVDLVYLLLLIGFGMLLHLQLLNLTVFLLDYLHEIAYLRRVVVPHRVQILLQLLSVPRLHLLNFKYVYHIGRESVVALGYLRRRRLIQLI